MRFIIGKPNVYIKILFSRRCIKIEKYIVNSDGIETILLRRKLNIVDKCDDVIYPNLKNIKELYNEIENCSKLVIEHHPDSGAILLSTFVVVCLLMHQKFIDNDLTIIDINDYDFNEYKNIINIYKFSDINRMTEVDYRSIQTAILYEYNRRADLELNY